MSKNDLVEYYILDTGQEVRVPKFTAGYEIRRRCASHDLVSFSPPRLYYMDNYLGCITKIELRST